MGLAAEEETSVRQLVVPAVAVPSRRYTPPSELPPSWSDLVQEEAMAVVEEREERRHEMYRKFEEVLGAEVASTVMEHLPPVGWADVATKRDLDAQSVLLRSEMAALRLEVKTELRGEVNRLLLWLFPTLVTTIAVTAGLAFSAGTLS
jgi:hypothetical protein